MSSLEELRADQHDDVTLTSDHAFTAFLAELHIRTARKDLTPTTPIERRHLARARSTA